MLNFLLSSYNFMALDEILSAIAKKTDEAIIAKREAQKATVAKRKQAHEETVQALQGSITDQCNQKKKAILQKAKSHAAAHIKNTELLTKQTALDTIFAATVSGFDALPKKT